MWQLFYSRSTTSTLVLTRNALIIFFKKWAQVHVIAETMVQESRPTQQRILTTPVTLAEVHCCRIPCNITAPQFCSKSPQATATESSITHWIKRHLRQITFNKRPQSNHSAQSQHRRRATSYTTIWYLATDWAAAAQPTDRPTLYRKPSVQASAGGFQERFKLIHSVTH